MAHPSWGPAWPTRNPNIKTLVRDDGLKIPLHAQQIELWAILADETERLGYDLIPGWCWGYSNRQIRNTGRPSNHSQGTADDKNAPENPYGPRTGKIRQHPEVVALWKRYGYRWGGDYSGTADDMHFEYMGTVADCARHLKLAREEFTEGGQGTPLPQAPDDKGRPIVRKGDRGEHVEFLQERLIAHRHDLSQEGGVDGIFGPGLEHELKAFQAHRGAKPDGIAGPVTWGLLGEGDPPPESEPEMDRPQLQRGAEGQDVEYLQQRLNAHSPPARKLKVDGIFGTVTEIRVMQFQRAKGLADDGIVGPLTWGALA